MTLSRVTPESPCPKFEMIMKTGARDLFAFQVFLVCGLAGAGIPKCLFKTGFLWKCRSDFHMLCMKWVVQMPVSYVWSPNTGPASMRYQSQAGATVCSWAKQAELACSSTLWGVSCCIYDTPLTLPSPTNTITSLAPIQTNCKAQLMANTVPHHLISLDFAPAQHPLYTAQGPDFQWLLRICMRIVLHIMTGGNSCWSIQCTLMEAVMMKPGWPDLFVDKRLQRSHRKYFHIDFLGSWHWRHRGLTL